MPTFPRASVILILVAVLLAAAVAPAAAVAAQPGSARLVVGFRPGVDAAEQRAALRSVGAGVSERTVRRGAIGRLRAVVVPVPRARFAAVRARLLGRSEVAYVERDHTARATGDLAAAAWTPNDSFLDQQWGLAAMNVPHAWEFTRGAGVTVAVLDTGVDYVHPDLQGRVDLGRDFVESDDDPMDGQGHGTHVSGVIAANADDGYGIAGVAPNARILAVRVLDEQGEGDYSWVAKGIVYAVGKGAKVINLSLGGTEQSELLRAAIDYAAARGAIVTCASGNESAKQVSYPAKYDSCVAVGATGPDDEHADFSNVGAGLDLSAPGVQVLSSTPGGNHEAWDGTSMAAPSVSGLSALLFAQGLGRRDVLAAMTGTARDLGPAGLDTTFGAGRIDAGAAIDAAARAPRTAADTTAPTVSGVRLLAPRKVVRSSTKEVWKVVSSSAWKRVGTTLEPGSFTWSQSSTKGAVRTVSYFRARSGIVYRRIVKSKRTKVTKRQVTTIVRVQVDAADDLGVDRAAIEVNGTTRAVDWSAADGWVLEVPCVAGKHTFVGRAWDAADHEASGKLVAKIRC